MKTPDITSGPWTFEPLPENTWNVAGHIIAKGETVETATAMVKGGANAQAIAALPDLLAALEGLLNDWERVHGPIPNDHEVKAALVKAGYTF